MPAQTLTQCERLFYRDRLREARYSALADAEGFAEICFAIEALGMRLLGAEATLNNYEPKIRNLAISAPTLSELPKYFPELFTRFAALYDTVRRARNDAMHTGAYARHATSTAIELCIGLEEAIMKGSNQMSTVADFMVKTPVCVEPWQPVAHARQIMLTHSFSFLPVLHGNWKLLSDISLAKFLRGHSDRKTALALSIEIAAAQGLHLIDVLPVKTTDELSVLLEKGLTQFSPILWLVIGKDNSLAGVLSPFELM